MKKINSCLFLLALAIFAGGELFSQTVILSGEIRPRFEYRHGYKTLSPNGADAANFVSQRTRLNGYFANESFMVGLVIQDVRVWGDVPQLNTSDVNGTAIHEAWGEAIINQKLSIKVGRQEIVYDDSRIFGNVGWAQQARSHDAAIIKYKPTEKHIINVGFAYNANGETLFKTDYTVNSYKTFQYAWYHGKFGAVGLSFLVLNNGMAYSKDSVTQKITYSQTFGPRFTYEKNDFKFDASAYYQGGRNAKNNDLSALYFSANAGYKVSDRFVIALGGEYLSGTSSEETAMQGEKDKSFTPLYGTNHKFNGWMDYFYVGSYNGSNGLIDLYLPLQYTIEKVSFKLVPHYLLAAATVATQTSSGIWKEYGNGLGTEIDFSVDYDATHELNISAGYSQMLGTETLQVIKGGNYENTNNWGWIMLTFKPTFFSKK
ncbi:MAG: alginate export family protein [Bacteroidales bacterium]|jgi:hypothetical protein